jgi:hypothetical protein
MGFDRLLCDATSAKNCIGTVQGSLFRHLHHGNPSALIRTEPGLLRASELDQFGRR